MLGETEIQPSVSPSPEPAAPLAPPAPSYVPPTYTPPTSKFSLGPLLLGFFLVILVAGAIGVAYYTAKFKTAIAPSPTPSVEPSVMPSPSFASSATPSATPKTSLKPSTKPTSSTKPTPTATPFSLPGLDLRFGNPSANVKQTIDENNGAGRVINREYTSIQAGQFDEVSSTFSPKVTVCYHLVASESMAGKLIKFSMTLDDKDEISDTMSWIDNLEAGRIYDWCHDVTTSIGKHTAKLIINGDKSVKEANYGNDIASVTWENLADNVAPNFALTGPVSESGKSCLTASSITDNVTSTANLKLERKIDGGSWEVTTDPKYCFSGTAGSQHTFSMRVTDSRNNSTEQVKTFPLF